MDARTPELRPQTVSASAAGWRADAAAGTQRSLPEVNATVTVPAFGGHWARRLLAFLGPGYLVSVGYMDPGNWATDLAGGSKFGYTLLSVILLSNLMAILLQALAARLGIATDRDLAQACRASFSRPVNLLLWLACEAAIIACDLAEVIGTAIALKLLFGIPLIGGALITALDAFLLLLLMNRGFRFLEAFVIALLVVIAVCFAVQIGAAAPPVAAMLRGFVPSPEIVTNPEMLYIAIGIIGATVMPHNLYLHSSIVQTRAYERTEEGSRDAIKWATADSTIALMLALFINAAILIVAAATFHSSGHQDVAEIGRRSTAVAAARPRHRLDAVRGGAVGLRPQLDGDGDPGGPDRDGRFSAPAAAELGAAAGNPRHRHRAGDCHHRALWRARHRGASGVQPGRAVDAIAVRGDSAGAVRVGQGQDGQVRDLAPRRDPGLGRRRDHRGAEREAAVRYAVRFVARMERSAIRDGSAADRVSRISLRSIRATAANSILRLGQRFAAGRVDPQPSAWRQPLLRQEAALVVHLLGAFDPVAEIDVRQPSLRARAMWSRIMKVPSERLCCDGSKNEYTIDSPSLSTSVSATAISSSPRPVMPLSMPRLRYSMMRVSTWLSSTIMA